MRRLLDGELFLRAEAAPVGLDDARAGAAGKRHRAVRAARIDDENLVAKRQRSQAGRQLACGVAGDENGGKAGHGGILPEAGG